MSTADILDLNTNTQNVTPYQQRKTNVVWLDVNTNARINGKPDLLPDEQAINNALHNLFACPVGARGPIFQPTYGTFLHKLLQEPMDNTTAQKIRASTIGAIQEWEPRVQIIPQQTFVLPNAQMAGYIVQIAYIYILTNEFKRVAFFVQP